MEKRYGKGPTQVRPPSALDTCQHMSSHYRRILNAKPIVDTSIPSSFNYRLKKRTGQPISSGSSTSSWLKENSAFKSSLKIKLDNVHSTSLCPKASIRTKNLEEKPDERFVQTLSNFQPRILKTNVRSKLLNDLHTYYPPRRKHIKNESDKVQTVQGSKKILPIEVTGTSSRDSAYSVSSIPESRNQTPVQPGISYSFSSTKKQISSATQTDFSPNELRPGDDGIYTKVMLDITQEVIENSLFTNQSISKVMRKHYTLNMHENLNKDKMCDQLMEIANQLEIPLNSETLTWLIMEKAGVKKENRTSNLHLHSKFSPLVEDIPDECSTSSSSVAAIAEAAAVAATTVTTTTTTTTTTATTTNQNQQLETSLFVRNAEKGIELLSDREEKSTVIEIVDSLNSDQSDEASFVESLASSDSELD